MGQERTPRENFKFFLTSEADHEWHMIDGTMIRAHRHAAGARGGQESHALGRSCGGFSSNGIYYYCRSEL